MHQGDSSPGTPVMNSWQGMGGDPFEGSGEVSMELPPALEVFEETPGQFPFHAHNSKAQEADVSDRIDDEPIKDFPFHSHNSKTEKDEDKIDDTLPKSEEKEVVEDGPDAREPIIISSELDLEIFNYQNDLRQNPTILKKKLLAYAGTLRGVSKAKLIQVSRKISGKVPDLLWDNGLALAARDHCKEGMFAPQ